MKREGESSTVEIDQNAGTVVKRYTSKWRHFGDFERELAWVRSMVGLYKWHHLPNRILGLQYRGEPVTTATLPGNWRVQAEWLLNTLGNYRCQHNDIRPENILVLDGELHLIDYQWATPQGTPPPTEWPARLGGRWRACGVDTWYFDDRTSLYKSLEAVEAGEA